MLNYYCAKMVSKMAALGSDANLVACIRTPLPEYAYPWTRR